MLRKSVATNIVIFFFVATNQQQNFKNFIRISFWGFAFTANTDE
jgi:hypothetical protein